MGVRLPAAIIGALLLVALPASAQNRVAQVRFGIPAAAELSASGSGAGGAVLVNGPGAATTLTFSYRASKQSGRVAIMVTAEPADGGVAAPVEVLLSGGNAPSTPIAVAPGATGVVLWTAGANAHGLRRTLQVHYSFPAGAHSPVRLVYSIVAS